MMNNTDYLIRVLRWGITFWVQQDRTRTIRSSAGPTVGKGLRGSGLRCQRSKGQTGLQLRVLQASPGGGDISFSGVQAGRYIGNIGIRDTMRYKRRYRVLSAALHCWAVRKTSLHSLLLIPHDTNSTPAEIFGTVADISVYAICHTIRFTSS